jgi:hypothetical protein
LIIIFVLLVKLFYILFKRVFVSCLACKWNTAAIQATQSIKGRSLFITRRMMKISCCEMEARIGIVPFRASSASAGLSANRAILTCKDITSAHLRRTGTTNGITSMSATVGLLIRNAFRFL